MKLSVPCPCDGHFSTSVMGSLQQGWCNSSPLGFHFMDIYMLMSMLASFVKLRMIDAEFRTSILVMIYEGKAK